MSESATTKRPIAATCTLVALASLAACGGEPPPPSVAELLADKVLLDATMVRCLQQHEGTNYAPECIAAREAAGQLAVAAEQARKDELEAESGRKRDALRRAQEAADAARQAALALAEERATAEYLGLLPAEPAAGQAGPAATGELQFITVDGEPRSGQSEVIADGNDEASPQVTVQEIDLGALLPPPPVPEPEAE